MWKVKYYKYLFLNFGVYEIVLRSLSRNPFIRNGIWLPFRRLNMALLPSYPSKFLTSRPFRYYGNLLNKLERMRPQIRNQNFWTYFMRNRPELELLTQIAESLMNKGKICISVVACSKGAEVYSLLMCLRKHIRNIHVEITAIDISEDIVRIAEKGEYPDDSPMLERLTEFEIKEMFDRKGHILRVKDCLRENVNWLVGDATSPELLESISSQDIVMANRFLCHMYPDDAEKCLKNVSKILAPGGFLFVSGVDLDVRTKVARTHGWKPISDLMEQIHDGDYTLRRGWPMHYYGLEPFDKKRKDWNLRYASVFQMPQDHNLTNNGI